MMRSGAKRSIIGYRGLPCEFGGFPCEFGGLACESNHNRLVLGQEPRYSSEFDRVLGSSKTEREPAARGYATVQSLGPSGTDLRLRATINWCPGVLEPGPGCPPNGWAKTCLGATSTSLVPHPLLPGEGGRRPGEGPVLSPVASALRPSADAGASVPGVPPQSDGTRSGNGIGLRN